MKVLRINSSGPISDRQDYYKELVKYKDLDLTILMAPYWAAAASGSSNIFFHNWKKVYVKRYYDHNSGYKLIVKRPFFIGKSFHFYLTLFPFLSKIKPDIIHVECEPWQLVLLQAIIWRNLFSPKTKIMFDSFENMYQTYHDRFFYNLIQYKIIEKLNVKYSDGAFGGTSLTIDVLRKKGFNKLAIITGDEFNPEVYKKIDVSELKKKLGLENFILGYVGRLEEAKGILTLLRALGKIKDKDFTLLLVGQSETGFETKIKDLIKELSLTSRVVFAGLVPHQDIVKYYNVMDVLIIPSETTKYWREQTGRTISEGMCCETAVIGSDSGGIPEIIGGAGLIFKEKDVNDLKDKILELYNNPKKLQELSKAARERVLRDFTPQIKAEKTHNFYKHLLNNSR